MRAGECYPCSVGRFNTCDNFQLIGIHVDGGLQERLCMREDHVFPIASDDPAVASMAEPVSIAVRAVERARIAAGERVVVLGAGPIGQCVSLVAIERGAEVLLDRPAGVAAGAGPRARRRDACVDDRRRGGRRRPAVGGSGRPAGRRRRHRRAGGGPRDGRHGRLGGRAVQVGMSVDEVPIRIGSLTEKELDFLGVCCCGTGEFAGAVEVVERNGPALARMISHQFPLAEAPRGAAVRDGQPERRDEGRDSGRLSAPASVGRVYGRVFSGSCSGSPSSQAAPRR